MNSGPTSERVYDVLRYRLLARTYGPGQRLDPAILARDLATSITPVRDALHLLAGRGLVDVGTGEGFHVVQIDAPALADLYAWNLDVLLLALRSWPQRAAPDVERREDLNALERDPVVTFTAICSAIGHLSTNVEHRRAIDRLNDRLHPLRVAEASVIEDDGAEIAALNAAMSQRDSRTFASFSCPITAGVSAKLPKSSASITVVEAKLHGRVVAIGLAALLIPPSFNDKFPPNRRRDSLPQTIAK